MESKTTVTTTTTQLSSSPLDFPAELRGKRVLLASESLGPVNGVSRTTQSLIDYLRRNGVQVATVAPTYVGQHINASGVPTERQPLINKDWVKSIQSKSSTLGSRAIGGAWLWHHDRDETIKENKQPFLHSPSTQKGLPMLQRTKSDDARRKLESARLNSQNPELRLTGLPLPYNPDLTVAYPFRLGVTYNKTFKPDLIYLASPASVGFQFLVQLMQLDEAPPTLLNFQTDLSHYSTILFRAPIDRYAVFLLQMVQGYLFRSPIVHSIFYPSAYVRQYMQAAGAPPDKMVQLGRGVDTELFNPSRRDGSYRKQLAPNGEIIFCCISRLAPEKGFDFLAQAAKKLADTGLDFKLLIVGGNKNPSVDAEVRRYFKPLGDRVVFTGFLRGTELAGAYASADIFLHCSITETFGLVVLESMASGVPVIAREEGGPAETVKEGATGYLTAPHDLEAFVARAQQLATDSSLRTRMAQAARQQALDTTWDNINNKVAHRLAAALAERKPKTAEEKAREGYYGTWASMARVYWAVGIVWIFWIIAVIPLLVCGLAHSFFG